MKHLHTVEEYQTMAKYWLLAGKLLTNETHKLNLDNFDIWVNEVKAKYSDTSPEYRIAQTLRTHMRHVRFNDFIAKFMLAFSRFLATSPGPYYIIAAISDDGMQKSNAWLAAIAVLLGEHLIDNYRHPEGIITHAFYFSHNGYDPMYNYVILDDAIYSGTQMQSNLMQIKNNCNTYYVTAFQEIYKKNHIEFNINHVKPKVAKILDRFDENMYIVCAFIGEDALRIFKKNMFYVEPMQSLRTLISPPERCKHGHRRTTRKRHRNERRSRRRKKTQNSSQ